MRSRHTAAAAAFLAVGTLLVAPAVPSAADEVHTPECQRQLANSVQLITAIKGREKRFAPGNMTKNCELLQQNLTDMVKAREPMDRCLTGREKDDAIGQLDASIKDMKAFYAGSCQP